MSAESSADAAEREADALAARGDIAGAGRLLEQCLAADPARPDSWLKLGALRRAQGNLQGALAAVRTGLERDPLHFMLLMSRGSLLDSLGETDEAARYYLRALAQLPDDAAIPPGLQAVIGRARAAGDAFRNRTADRWSGLIADMPDLDGPTRRKLDRFVTNALHRTRVYHSEPTHYHYPGLIEREFHDRTTFPWLTGLEAATDVIRGEYLALARRGSARPEPYVQYDKDLPTRQWAALNHSLDWTAFHLMRNGLPVAENADACPATLAALAPIDQPEVGGRSPNAMFSLLKPRTRIPPHTGVANTRLVCHLPLIVPPGCWFRVGAERREWREGEAFVFDDTIEHEAANDSDAPRVVLIFDIWHPQLALAERAAVATLMEADDSEGGSPL